MILRLLMVMENSGEHLPAPEFVECLLRLADQHVAPNFQYWRGRANINN